jgi:hypothetical protein
LFPGAWQSPLETDRDGTDDEAGTRADPVLGSVAGAAVFGSAAGAAGLIVGTLEVDPCGLLGTTVPPAPGENDPGAGSCW